MNRRNFLKRASTSCAMISVFSAGGCTHKKFYNPDQDIIIGGGRFKKNNEIQHVLAVANLQQRETQLVSTNFLPHGVYIDPNDKQRIATFEKDGTQAAVIDINNRDVVKHFSASETSTFSGHGAINRSGMLIYSIETDTESSNGKIIIRDFDSLQVIDELSTFGKNPHHCKMIEDDKLIAVANSGDNNSSASVAFIDLENNKLADDRMIEGEDISSCHFSVSKDNRLIIGSAPTSDVQSMGKTGHVRISNSMQELKTMTEPKEFTDKLIGEALSICIDETHDIAAITHPLANLLTFWSISEQKLFKAMSVPNPRGITLSLDNKHYIVCFGTDTSSILVRTKDLVADKESIMQPSYISADHVINWSKTLAEIMPGERYG